MSRWERDAPRYLSAVLFVATLYFIEREENYFVHNESVF